MRFDSGFAVLVILFSVAPILAAEPVTATITTKSNGRVVEQTPRHSTLLHGVALATFATGQIEEEVSENFWKKALERDYIRVEYSQPTTIALSVQSGDARGPKSYDVHEFLVPTAISTGSPMARVGDKYFAFGKWDPRILLLLKDMLGISSLE